ncbi:MAG TPA: hypothetical protein VLK37_07245 [Solirubrobacterales bacterium]|nr:hypothetical protein [Solirubrobacterales bacterium]
MIVNRNRRWAYGLFVLALAYLGAFYLIPLANGDGKATSEQCVPRHKIDLDHGRHGGEPWHIRAGVEKNPDCSYWLLKVEFSPQGKYRGSWTDGWGIPGGGHLPASATIDASEEEEGLAMGGVVGLRVHNVVLSFTGGRTLVVGPKTPRDSLLRRFVWLHGLRYFLCFFPAGEHVETAKLLDAKGKIISTVHNQEGEFVGFMGA